MYWLQSNTRTEVDIGVLEESALAMAQSTIQNVMNEAGVSKAEMARRMQCNRSFVTRMLTGSHNLTIKTIARSLRAALSEISV
jgi:plasmid maintenance system antidote protein VapI